MLTGLMGKMIKPVWYFPSNKT